MTDDLEAYYSDDNPEPLLKCRELLHYLLLPVILSILVVLYLEFFRDVGHALHQKLVLAERAILLYFVAEVGLDFVLFEDKVEFFKEKWFDILLILPFLAMFRAAGRLGRVFQGMRSLQLIQLGEIPLAAGFVAGEGAQGARMVKASKIAKYVPKFQKTLHLLRELPSVLSYIPKVQSIVYIVTETKRSASQITGVVLGTGVLAALAGRFSRSESAADTEDGSAQDGDDAAASDTDRSEAPAGDTGAEEGSPEP
jgi:hypothetical protein